ncbi:MAG: hypothetical protein IJY40_09855 [Oscillospiraceae bacterium]|nr:hypothetical protein [Oscillospiraceae bacterium]
MVEKLLRQYGVDLLLGERPVRGLFQSVVGKLDRLAKLEPGALGLESRKRYVYIGPLDPEPREDMILLVQGKEYVIRAAHRIMGPDGPLYSWAMCVEKGSGNGL